MLKTKPPKPRPCAVCRELFTPVRINLKLTKVCLNAGCILDYAQGIRAKAEKKANIKQKREFRDNDKSFQKAKAQKAFNAYIRERDKDEGCISCDKTKDWQGQWHAGHYKTVGARPDLRFDERNVHKQCSVCNNYLSGNLANYRKRLIQKIGLDQVEDLDRDGSPKKYTAADYKAIYDRYR